MNNIYLFLNIIQRNNTEKNIYIYKTYSVISMQEFRVSMLIARWREIENWRIRIGNSVERRQCHWLRFTSCQFKEPKTSGLGSRGADFLQCESSAACLCIVTDLIKATSVMLALLLTAGPSKLTRSRSIDRSIPRSFLTSHQFRLSARACREKASHYRSHTDFINSSLMDDPNKRNNRNHLSLFLNNSSFSRKRNLKKVEYEKKKKKKANFNKFIGRSPSSFG